MNNASFLGLYIMASLLATCVSVVLALLKIFNVITIPWLFVAIPLYAIFVFAIAAFIIIFSIQEIKARCNRNRYIRKNLYE